MVFPTRNISFVISLLLVICTVASQSPQTPCPDVFNYQYDATQNEWSGMVRTPSPEFGVRRVLGVNLTMRDRFPSNGFVGRIELVDNQAKTIEKIRNHQDITYRVVFPLKHSVPQVTVVTIDGREVCRGQPDPQATSNIHLDYTLLTETLTNRQQSVLSQTKPNLADSIQKYEAYQANSENTNVALPPRQRLENDLLPPPIPTSPKQRSSQKQTTLSPSLTVNDPQISTSIKQIKYEQLEQQLHELNRDLLEEIKILAARSDKGNKSVFFKYSTNFYYVV